MFLPHRFILYSIASCERVTEDAQLGGGEGEYDKKGGDHCKGYDRRFRGATGRFIFVELFGFIEVCYCRGNEEDCDIQPIGGFAYSAVVGIKENWNEREPQKCSAELDAPKIFEIFEGKALE